MGSQNESRSRAAGIKAGEERPRLWVSDCPGANIEADERERVAVASAIAGLSGSAAGQPATLGVVVQGR